MKIERTKMLDRYFLKFIFRLSVFVSVFVFYLYNKSILCEIVTHPLYKGLDINLIHLLWCVFMFIMIRHLFPTEKLSMALRKGKRALCGRKRIF